MIHSFESWLLVFCLSSFQSSFAAVISTRSSAASIALDDTAPSPQITDKPDLRRRQAPFNTVCGIDGLTSVTCPNNLGCQGLIIPNGRAYAYCSTPSAAQQVITTAFAHGSWFADDCPKYAACCASDLPSVKVDLYISDGLTVTGYECAGSAETVTFSPLINLLNPTFYSSWLDSNAHDPSSSVDFIQGAVPSGVTESIPPTTGSQSAAVASEPAVPGGIVTTTVTSPKQNPKAHTTSSGSGASSSTSSGGSSSSTGASSSNSNGQAESNRIALGVGIGIGLPATIAALITLWLLVFRGR